MTAQNPERTEDFHLLGLTVDENEVKFRAENMTHLILKCKINRVCFFYNPGQDVCVDNLAVPSQLSQMKIVSFPHQNRNSIFEIRS